MKCRVCGSDEGEFYAQSILVPAGHDVCKACCAVENERLRPVFDVRQETGRNADAQLLCCDCLEFHNLDEFRRYSTVSVWLGFHVRCKGCASEYAERLREKRAQRRHQQLSETGGLTCPRCGEDKNQEDFAPSEVRSLTMGYGGMCRGCRKAQYAASKTKRA